LAKSKKGRETEQVPPLFLSLLFKDEEKARIQNALQVSSTGIITS
jgi:hypothetical protein